MRLHRSHVGPRVLAALLAIGAAGCLPSAPREVVVYSALDREFSEPLLDAFERKSGIVVRAKYDVESTKTVGLVNEIFQEQARPRCDVFWNNEILHTLRLDEAGLLDACVCAEAERFPADYRSLQGRWYGFAARARVLLVNTEIVAQGQWPDSIEDLADPAWRGRAGIAKPLFGTTATHAAVLFATWGPARAEAFFRGLKKNAQVLSGNKQVALDVAAGRLAFGLTDTDDAIIEVDRGAPVRLTFPDQGPDQMGALFIPNTIAVIRGAPHAAAARELIDYLLAPDVEARLAMGDSAQFPLGEGVDQASRAAFGSPLKKMDVDFAAAARAWEGASTVLRDLFTIE